LAGGCLARQFHPHRDCKQHYIESAPVREDVVALVRSAESFNAVLLDTIDRLTSEKIASFRAKLKKMI